MQQSMPLREIMGWHRNRCQLTLLCIVPKQVLARLSIRDKH